MENVMVDESMIWTNKEAGPERESTATSSLKADLPQPELTQPKPEPNAESPGAVSDSLEAEPASRFTVSIVSARGLRNADWLPGAGKSDCYCILKAVGKDGELHRTRTINNTLDPLWNEEVQVDEPVEALELSVWDQDYGHSDALGRATLRHTDFENDGFNGELALEGAGKGITAYISVKVKVAGQAYPLGPPNEVIIKIERVPNKPMGLDIDAQDNTFVYVTAVNAGPFSLYNRAVAPSEQLRSGDFIARANGVGGSASGILEQMKQNARLELLVLRPRETSIAIHRRDANQPLGLEITKKPIGNALLITSVADGVIAEHNAAHPDQEVRAGDRIVAVGGRRAAGEVLLKSLTGKGTFHITIARAARDA